MAIYKLGSIGTDTLVKYVETDSQFLYAFRRKEPQEIDDNEMQSLRAQWHKHHLLFNPTEIGNLAHNPNILAIRLTINYIHKTFVSSMIC